jgi:uridylate kinase
MTSTAQRQRFDRVLLKLSGESFCAKGSFGVDGDELKVIAGEVIDATRVGAKVAIVVGGGNIIRGARLAEQGLIHQHTADNMGMLGTVINGLALAEALTAMGVQARCQSAVRMPSICEPYMRPKALRHLEKGRVLVLAGGVGNPYFTTDSGAALRAIELGCNAMLKATKVDGVYTADPKKDPKATRYTALTYAEALEKRLNVLDMTALALCRDHKLPTLVFDFDKKGNIARAVAGEDIGTLVTV